MKTKPKPTAKKPMKEKLSTTPISVRVKDSHLADLHAMELATGVQRSAHIQLAISEYLEKRRK